MYLINPSLRGGAHPRLGEHRFPISHQTMQLYEAQVIVIGYSSVAGQDFGAAASPASLRADTPTHNLDSNALVQKMSQVGARVTRISLGRSLELITIIGVYSDFLALVTSPHQASKGKMTGSPQPYAWRQSHLNERNIFS